MKKLLPKIRRRSIFLGLALTFLLFLSLKFPNPLAAQEEGAAGINIDPTNPGGRPSANDLLTSGTAWVRFVYKPNSGFNYNSYINELHQAGIEVNLVLNQETLWPSEGITPTYVDSFANLAGNTAQQFSSRVAAYEIWNEQDVAGIPTSIYIPPELYAPLLTASYNSIKSGNPNVWVVTGGALSGNPDYLRRVIDAAGGLPADGIGVHPYTPNIEEVRQTILNFLSVSQGKPLWITEFGWEVADQQRQADYLKNVYELVAQFGDQVATAMWYAWSDLMNPGFGLIDASGNPKLAFQYFQQFAALLESILPFFEFLPFPIPPVPPPPTCQVDIGGDRDSRPIPCDSCNQTILYCPSCATSFTVHDEVTFYWYDGEKCPPDKEEYWVYPEWSGKVTIDPTQTTIPFVGYKGEGEDKSDYEQKYLADYFEGTNEYYQNYSIYWLDWINHAGVLRKLTPMEYQNQLKKQMVQRAQTTKAWGGRLHEGGIHDYELEYKGRLCWDFPFLADAFLALLQRYATIPSPLKPAIDFISDKAHYCVFEGSGVTLAKAAINFFNSVTPSPIHITIKIHTTNEDTTLTALAGHFPPEPDEEDYVKKWDPWKKSVWGKLWTVVPMVSREDTPGEIAPYLGWRPRDEPKYIPPTVEEVPHVARLFETSQEVNNMLLPYQEFARFAEKETKPIIASAKENVLGEKTLLAQADFPYGCKWLYGNWPDDCSCLSTGTCRGEHGACCPPHPGWGPICGWEDCQVGPGTRCESPPANDCPAAVIIGPSPEPPEPGGCGLARPRPVAACEQPAITDTNPNDDLCCKTTIDIPLQAVDSFNITDWYKKCEEKEREGDPCKIVSRTRPVSRKFGINLSHPYLTDIWNQTGKADTRGLFNIFRPAKVSKFQEIDAADEIQYYYKDSQESVEPATGKFYFNYLGGVQLAKEWVIRTLAPWKE